MRHKTRSVALVTRSEMSTMFLSHYIFAKPAEEVFLAPRLTRRVIHTGKVYLTKQGGCLWYLGKDTVPGLGYGGYAVGVVV